MREWTIGYVINVDEKHAREDPKLSPEGLLKLHVNFQMLYHSLQQSVSCWLDSYVARSWYRGPSPGPSVLTLEVGEVLDQMPFQSQRILHQSHSLLQVVVTSHGSCWSMWTKQTSLVGSPTDNLIVGGAQQGGQIWAYENAFLGLCSEQTIGIWAWSSKETSPQAALELGTIHEKLSSPLGADQCELKDWIIQWLRVLLH